MSSASRPMELVHQAATSYLLRGWQPLPIPDVDDHPVKGPRVRNWETFRCSAPEVPQRFDTPGNLGVLLGEPSQGLLDVDLDAHEAVALAGLILPQTGAIFGRPGKRASHWLYQAASEPGRIRQWRWSAEAGGKLETLLELRANGAQTVVPPSLHPSGELVAWEQEGEPSVVEREDLERVCCRLAACVLLVRAGWEAESAVTFAEDPTADALGQLEPRVADQVARWLGLGLHHTQPAPSAPGLPHSAELPTFDQLYATLGPGGIAALVPELSPRVVCGERPRLEVRCPAHQGERPPAAWVLTEHTPRIECKHLGTCGYTQKLSDYLCERDGIGYPELLARLRERAGLALLPQRGTPAPGSGAGELARAVRSIPPVAVYWRWLGALAMSNPDSGLAALVPAEWVSEFEAAEAGQKYGKPPEGDRIRKLVKARAEREERERTVASNAGTFRVVRVLRRFARRGSGGVLDLEIEAPDHYGVTRQFSVHDVPGDVYLSYLKFSARAASEGACMPDLGVGAKCRAIWEAKKREATYSEEADLGTDTIGFVAEAIRASVGVRKTDSSPDQLGAGRVIRLDDGRWAVSYAKLFQAVNDMLKSLKAPPEVMGHAAKSIGGQFKSFQTSKGEVGAWVFPAQIRGEAHD